MNCIEPGLKKNTMNNDLFLFLFLEYIISVFKKKC